MNYDFLDGVYDSVPKDKICVVDKSTGELVWSDGLNYGVVGRLNGYSNKNKTLYLDSFDDYEFVINYFGKEDDRYEELVEENGSSGSVGAKYDNKNIKKSFAERMGWVGLDESDELLDGYAGVDVELLDWEIDVLSGVCRLDYKNNRGLSMRKLIFIIKNLDEVSASSIMEKLNIKKSHAYNYLGAYKIFAEAFRVQMNRVKVKANPWKSESNWYSKYLDMKNVGMSVRGIAKELSVSESTLRSRVKSKEKEDINV